MTSPATGPGFTGGGRIPLNCWLAAVGLALALAIPAAVRALRSPPPEGTAPIGSQR